MIGKRGWVWAVAILAAATVTLPFVVRAAHRGTVTWLPMGAHGGPGAGSEAEHMEGGMHGAMMRSGMMGRMHNWMMGGTATAWQARGGTVVDADRPLPAATVQVELRDMRFTTARLTVTAGTTVVFVNRDPFQHRVMQSSAADLEAREPAFVSPLLESGQAWAYTFAQPGTYPILCDVGGHHLAGMVGEVVVTD